jgi:hypothetical protein
MTEDGSCQARFVMPGPVPGIHVLLVALSKTWMTGPAMTFGRVQ